MLQNLRWCKIVSSEVCWFLFATKYCCFSCFSYFCPHQLANMQLCIYSKTWLYKLHIYKLYIFNSKMFFIWKTSFLGSSLEERSQHSRGEATLKKPLFKDNGDWSPVAEDVVTFVLGKLKKQKTENYSWRTNLPKASWSVPLAAAWSVLLNFYSRAGKLLNCHCCFHL